MLCDEACGCMASSSLDWGGWEDNGLDNVADSFSFYRPVLLSRSLRRTTRRDSSAVESVCCLAVVSRHTGMFWAAVVPIRPLYRNRARASLRSVDISSDPSGIILPKTAASHHDSLATPSCPIIDLASSALLRAGYWVARTCLNLCTLYEILVSSSTRHGEIPSTRT